MSTNMYLAYFNSIAHNESLNKAVGGGDPIEVGIRQTKLILDTYPSDLSAPSVALDFGCGVGRTIPFLSVFWPRTKFIGIDISTDFLNFCSKQPIFQECKFYKLNSYVTHYENFSTSELLGSPC